MTESHDKMASSSSESLDLPAELIRRYKEDCEIRGMSPESLRRYISSLKIYNRYLQELNLDLLNVDRNVLRSFLEYLRKDRNVGLKTVGNYFTSMAMFYEFLEYEGYVDKNPVHFRNILNPGMRKERFSMSWKRRMMLSRLMIEPSRSIQKKQGPGLIKAQLLALPKNLRRQLDVSTRL